jgi:hypothetical protein
MRPVHATDPAASGNRLLSSIIDEAAASDVPLWHGQAVSPGNAARKHVLVHVHARFMHCWDNKQTLMQDVIKYSRPAAAD